MEATLVETVNRLASLYMKTTDTILKDIRAHSSDLATVQSLYVEASERISSVFFCEEYATPMEGKRRTLNVPHHSAGASGFTSLNPFIDGGYRRGRVQEVSANYDMYIESYIARVNIGTRKERWEAKHVLRPSL